MFRRRVMVSAALLGLGLACLGAAAAQRPLNPPNYYLFDLARLEPGTAVVGELTSDDGQSFKDGSYVDLFAFDGRAGQRVSILVSSAEFDPYLTLYDREGVVLSANDDRDGMFTDAGITAELPANGRYLVVVSGYSQFDLGAYTVALDDTSSASPEARPLELPATVSSALTLDMPTATDTWLGPTEYYAIEVDEPVALLVTMSSSEFDTVLTLLDDDMVQIAQNDDSGPSSDSQLFAKLERGRYLVAASSYFPDGYGNYELSLETYVRDQ